jgi:transposase
MSTSKSTSRKYSPEVRERAVRMVFEHQDEYESQWAAMASIAEKIGCTTESLRKWVRQAERDQGRKPGLTSEERERLKALERENKELRRANEILRKASAFFAQAELDRPKK